MNNHTYPWSLQTVQDRCEMDGDCWIWKHSVNNKGLPQACIHGKGGQSVRKFVFRQRSDRSIGQKLRLTSVCQNRRCVAPDHVVCMTASDILTRAYRTGNRSAAGEYLSRVQRAHEAGYVKLGFEQARVIRQRIRDGETVRAIAKELGMWESSIRDIKHNRTWRDTAKNASVFNLAA